MNAHAVTDIPEGDLCRLLFGDAVFSSRVRTELSIETNEKVFFELCTSQLFPSARGPGDIDVLAFDPCHPQKATAIEVKRVKLPPHAFHTEMVGKLNGVKRGVEQANLLDALGFHRTYFLVAVVCDGREQSGLNFAFRGVPTEKLMLKMDSFPRREQLNAGVGIAYVYITQPLDKDIRDAGGIGVRVVRQPIRREQPARTSEVCLRVFGTESRA